MSDENFVSDVVDDLKKQGLFDRFRKECLADVDTKPAYQNLQLRVKEAVGKYLHSLKWKSDLNKNQLRENLRRHLNELPMLTNGIDRVVEQVVKPKVMKSLKPQVDGVICEHMNIAYEQWLSDQNDAQKKKLAKVEEVVVPPPVLPSLCTSAAVPPSFPPVMTVPLVPPISAPPPIINDLQLPPPPPPSFEEPNDSTSSPHNPPPPPPPLPSDASEDELSVPAPPPDVYRSVSSPPPLPPDDDDDENNAAIPPEVEETGMAEEGCNQEDDAFEDVESSHIIKTCPDVEDPPDESNTASDRACDSISGNLCGKTSAAGRSSDGRSPNDSFSNENSFPFLNSEVLNDDGVSKEYRFAWNNFNESDLSNISVSSVHTSDLSNFEEDEDLDASLNDPDQNLGKIHSKDGDVSKDSDSKQSTSVRHSLNESVHGSLDTSNASFNSSGRRRTKKEELKERKMEEKKELKRQRVLNRRYCSEDFMSIFSDKQNLQQKQEAREEAKTKDICHSESKIDGDEDIKLDGEANASDLENAYSPYSNISEASSESVVVLGVEPAKPKKGKKAKSRKRSRSSDGNRRKKKRRRHKSSRRSSRHCSGGDDEIEDMSCYLKQDGIRTKSSVHEFDNNSSKGYPEEELADDYYMDEFCSDATKKKLKKSVDRINFGEAERQAAAFRMTAGSKQLPFPVTSPTWQKQTFSSPPRSSRQHAHGFVGQPNFTPMTATTGHKHIRHAPSLYHQQPITVHSMHEARIYDRTKHINEPDSYRHSRNVSKKSSQVECNGDETLADNNGFKRIKRNNDEEKVRHLKQEKSAKIMTEEFQKDSRQQKRDYFETRNKR